jgi:galactokinase
VSVGDRSFERAADSLARVLGATPAHRLFVPGRIEILGKHTDYAGGRSLTCAAERGFAVTYAPRADATLRIVDAHDGRRCDLPLDGSVPPQLGHWSNYPATVVRRLSRNFGALRTGADVAFHSSLPRAAGLSTSSALITAIFMALADVNALREREDFRAAVPDGCALAGYLGSIENGRAFGPLEGDGGVGTSGGSEDHTAIVLSVADALSCYRYHPVERLGQFELPPSLTLVVAASGIAAAKTGAARDRYNRAADLVAELVSLATPRGPELQIGHPTTLADVVDSSADAVATLRGQVMATASPFPSADLLRRLDHFLEEDRRILPGALHALGATDWSSFGSLVDASQHAAQSLLGNQVDETVTLQRLARELGAHAASAFGAGFGGSVWALVDAEGAAEFAGRWLFRYAERHPDAAERATSFVTRPAAGVAPGVRL